MMAAADLVGEKYGKYTTDYHTHVRWQVDIDKLVGGLFEGQYAEAADLCGLNTLMLDFYVDPSFVLPDRMRSSAYPFFQRMSKMVQNPSLIFTNS